jgi:ParB-like chromosome segregation protein Spo0J
MHTLPVDPESIFVGERHRALDDEAVSRLQASIAEIGLKHPICIRIVDEMEIDGELVAGVPVLVTGRHRLEAVRRLKWARVDCVEIADDALQAEMWEIAENLHRCDLTKEQRDEHIRRYAELLESQRATILVQNEPVSKRGPGQPKAIARQIADATGLSKATVRRALSPPKPIPLPVEPIDVTEQQFRALMAAWNRAGREAREHFLAEVTERIAA